MAMSSRSTTIVENHDKCVHAFERLLSALQAPARDFGEQLSLAAVREEYGRFRVWRGNVGAQHEAAARISLDYRLREAVFYRDKIVRHLCDLTEALEQGEWFSWVRAVWIVCVCADGWRSCGVGEWGEGAV
jgi:hypothetical protein